MLLLIIAGGALLLMACERRRQELKQRLMRAAVGTAFVAYGLYLMLFYRGGMIFLTTLVFTIPIAMGLQFFRERAEYKLQQEQADYELRQEMAALTRQYAPGSPFGRSDGDPTR